MRRTFLIICLFSSLALHAQKPLDSLLNVLNSTKEKREKIEILSLLTSVACDYSLDSGIYYNKIAVNYAKKIKDNKLIVNKLLDLILLYEVKSLTCTGSFPGLHLRPR